MKPTLKEEILKIISDDCTTGKGGGVCDGCKEYFGNRADKILKLIQKRIPKEDKKPKFSVTNYDEYVWGRVDGWNACIAEMKEEING